LLEHGNFAILKNTGVFDAMNKGWLENIHKIAENLNKDHDTTRA
jgi:hypothetical protein